MRAIKKKKTFQSYISATELRWHYEIRVALNMYQRNKCIFIILVRKIYVFSIVLHYMPHDELYIEATANYIFSYFDVYIYTLGLTLQ